MSTTTKRNYRATFILDNRGKEDSAEQIIAGVKQEIVKIGGEVGVVENLGRKDFIRVTDPKFSAGTYVQVAFAAPPSAPAALREQLRLNPSIYRTFVQSV
ncbi:MAG: 30S ribosomal protein S6 [Verrucomicrobiota bacterium]